MKYYKHIFATFLLLFLIPMTYTLAQESLQKTIDGETYTYTSTLTELEGVTMYYNQDMLVFSEVDKNDDGKPEQWLVFDENTAVRKELRDSNGNGEPDITFTYSPEEELVSSEGEGLKQYEPDIPEITEEAEEALDDSVDDTADYAGDLSDIEKLAGEGGGWWHWLFIVGLLFGAGYWFKQKRNRDS